MLHVWMQMSDSSKETYRSSATVGENNKYFQYTQNINKLNTFEKNWATSHQIRVPQSDDTVQRHLTHQQIVHPPKRKLQILDVMPFQVWMQRG